MYFIINYGHVSLMFVQLLLYDVKPYKIRWCVLFILLFFHREKYLPTLLQIEVMLKLWFPQVTAQAPVTPNPADFSPQNISTHGKSNITPPHKHKDQLHIPVKVSVDAYKWHTAY